MSKIATFEHELYSVYVDLDGVLADFESGFEERYGIRPMFKDTFRHIMDDGKGFFENLPKMSDADILWEHVKKFQPTILTATGTNLVHAEVEKRRWVKKHYGYIDVITVLKSADKVEQIDEHELEYSILIDDREKSINPWIEKGGIGILHTSARDTIAQLEEIIK